MGRFNLLTKRKTIDLPIDLRLKIYDEALKLKNRNLKTIEIWRYLKKKNLDVKYNTLLNWVNGDKSPYNKLNVIKKFDKNLIYVVGAILGDGCAYKKIKNNSYSHGIIRLSVKDKEFAENFAKTISVVFDKREPYPLYWSKSLKLYVVSVSSKHLVEYVNRPISELSPIIKLSPIYFLKGLYDSEGSISIKFTKNKRVYPRIFFTINDKKLLTYVQKLLKKFGINSTISVNTPARKIKYIMNKKTSTKICYNLAIENLKGIYLFTKLINFTIKRKQNKLNKIVALIKKYGTNGAYERLIHNDNFDRRIN